MQILNTISTDSTTEGPDTGVRPSDDRVIDLRFGARYAASVAQESLAEVAAQVADVFALFMAPGSAVTLGPGIEIEHRTDSDGEPTVTVNDVIMNRLDHELTDSGFRTASPLEALNFLREVLDPIAPPITVTPHASAER